MLIERNVVPGAMTLGGIRIFASDTLPTDTIEDWSRVRSPSRAARRRRQGHRQRIGFQQMARPVVYHMPAKNALVMHPQTLVRFEAALARRSPTEEFWTAVRLALEEIGARLGARA